MDELLRRVVEHHNKIVAAKAEAVTFLSNNHERLGIPEPRFSETEFYLTMIAKRHGIEGVVATGAKKAAQQPAAPANGE